MTLTILNLENAQMGDIDEENSFFYPQSSSQTDNWQEKHNAFRKSCVINHQVLSETNEEFAETMLRSPN